MAGWSFWVLPVVLCLCSVDNWISTASPSRMLRSRLCWALWCHRVEALLPPLHPMSSCNLPAHINDHLSISIYFSPQNLSGTIRKDSAKAIQLPCCIHNIEALDGEVSELTRAQRPSMLTSRPSEHHCVSTLFYSLELANSRGFRQAAQ